MLDTTRKRGAAFNRSNFEENTPKAKKSERVIRLIQDVWSKNPIDLVVENEDGSKSIIKAEFDPDFDKTSGRRSDASKLAGGNRHGTASEKRVTLNLADDFYRIIQESTYSGSKAETGKKSDTHAGVNMWRYFVNPILYMERSSNETTPYTVSIDVKQKDNGNFVYSFHAERDAKNNGQPAPQTLHAAVNGAENDTANGLPTSSIRSTSGNSQEKSSGKASVEVENRDSDNGNADSDNGKREPKYTVIDGEDTAGKESALAETYDKAVKQGKGVEISEADLKKYQDIRDDPEQTLIEAVKKYYEESLKGTSVEVTANDGVVEIRFENDGKKKSVGWRMKADKAATFEKLHQLTENAEYAYSEVNRNENERTSIPMFHYFVNNAKIARRDIPVKIQVRDVITRANSKETRYYTHTLEKNMRGNSGPVAGTQGANIDSNAIAPSKTNIRSTAGNSQEKSSGRASVEVSGINNRTAAELRREYERRMQEYRKATQRDDRSYPYIAEMKWIQAAERRLAELDGGKRQRPMRRPRRKRSGKGCMSRYRR